MLWRFGWMATALFVPCLAIGGAMGKPEWIPTMIIILGVIVTLYVMLGGIKAVIWNDVMQFCIMFGGLAITLIFVVNNVEGGFGAIFHNFTDAGVGMYSELRNHYPEGYVEGTTFFGKIKDYFVFPMPFFAILLTCILGRATTYTSDQVMIQRFMTGKTIKDVRTGFLINAVADMVWMFVLVFVGVALFTFYNQNPGEVLPEFVNAGGIKAWAATKDADQIFPYFMGKIIPTGLTGLILAAIFAASLSSLDSAVTSLGTVATVDFYERLYLGRDENSPPRTPAEDRSLIMVSRIMTLIVGVIGVSLSVYVAKTGGFGSLMEMANKLINAFTGPIFGIFLLGMFTKRATTLGTFIGGFVGTGVTLFIVWCTNEPRYWISFLWPMVFGLTSTFVIGYIMSLVIPGDPAKGEKYNWFAIMKQDLVE